ncbi:copper oxidase [Zhengella mangrovi]|uniref:Copper oxidase n=2 Tax=Zhengella mangrovi TaxID=1982044 RepID=A0A2G1QSZ9_9HYPH|nr:copper oxidase [Zhengella mangrovi]
MDMLHMIFSSPAFLVVWALLAIASLGILVRDLRTRNSHLMPLMKMVWGLTVAYSGPLGLAIYWTCGRKEIPDDRLWRRSFRSVAHCYSGCGMGEIVGVIIAAGLLSLGNIGISVTTFILAYVAGYALTVGPLVQGGVAFHTAMWDAVLSETPSIAVMEFTAIGVNRLIGGNTGIGDPLFWSALVLSLTCGLIAAYPVNVLLIRFGVKEGMMDPRETH